MNISRRQLNTSILEKVYDLKFEHAYLTKIIGERNYDTQYEVSSL